MADVELLPLPEWAKRDDLGGLVPSEVRVEMCTYARANVAHATAAQAAEIEALRTEVERLQDSVNRLGLEGGQFMSRTAAAEARAERLAEALRWAERHCPCGARPESPDTHPHLPGCLVGAALAQEDRNG